MHILVVYNSLLSLKQLRKQLKDQLLVIDSESNASFLLGTKHNRLTWNHFRGFCKDLQAVRIKSDIKTR